MTRTCSLLAAALLLVPSPAAGQGLAVGGHVGTTGLGAVATLGLNPKLNLRASFGVVPIDVDIEAEGVDFAVDFPTFFRASVDYHPARSGLFVSGGALFFDRGGDVEVTGTFSGSKEFGDESYTAEQVGDLLGTFSLRNAQPFVGIGFGNAVGRSLGFTVDLGVGLGEKPTVELDATGPVADDPDFRDDLDAEEAKIEDDIPEALRLYPVVSLALTIGIG